MVTSSIVRVVTIGEVGIGTLVKVGAVNSTGGVRKRVAKDPSYHAGVQNDIASDAVDRSSAGAEKTDALIDKATTTISVANNASKGFLCVSFLRKVITLDSSIPIIGI